MIIFNLKTLKKKKKKDNIIEEVQNDSTKEIIALKIVKIKS